MGQTADLTGRVALVSGASRGIGRAIALGFAQAGARLALLARAEAALEALRDEIQATGGEALVVRCDVTSSAQVDAAAGWVLGHFGRLDVLVNNAGASPHDKPFLEMAESEWDDVLDLNLKGPMRLCRAFGPALLAQPGASVINVVSIGADTPVPGESVYSAAKAGLVSLTRSLAQEWSPRGVRVNAIAPGYVRTEINRRIWEPVLSGERDAAALAVFNRSVGRTPLGRYGEPDEIAALAVFLASDAASFVSGSTFFADGGWQTKR